MLKVGILGTGTMAKTHASGYRCIEGVQVAAFADEFPGSLEQIAKDYQAKAYVKYDDLINDPELDIIDVCLPTPLHKEFAIKAVQAGKHTFCEKPLARHLDDALEIKKVVDASKVKFMVGHVVRFFPEFITIKNLIDQGKLGKIGIARSCRNSGMPHGIKEWYHNQEMSGGVVLDLIIHDFDFMNWFFGKPKRVFARGLYQKTKEMLDYALVIIRYENGVIAHVEGSWAEPSGFSVKVEVSGSEGLLDVEPYKDVPLLINVRNEDQKIAGVTVPETPLTESQYTTELRHFIDCIREDKKPAVTVDDALYAVKVGLAALESIKTGKPVNID